MKFVAFSHKQAGHRQHAGILDGEQVACLTEAGLAASVLEVVQGGGAALEKVRAGLAKAPRYALADIILEAPIRPGKVLCSGINYKGHAEENPNAKMPTEPFFFAKLPSSVVGPDARVEKPVRTEQMDYEVEFTAVIGKPLHKASEADVMPAIFGYTLLNDISARDVQFKDNQITIGKNFAGFAPIGPCIVTTDELTRPDDVALKTRLNGKLLQNGSTSDWLFSLPRLISFLSHYVPLEPGDLVSTGTPAGVGAFQKPQIFMKAGDVVEIEAAGIGVLRTPIVAG
ncbi:MULTISPECIES: fumarylacetoacetate hydrolase family protein [unclassified Mesorhizobium]|uniref:fumarylacetoacetate hydrolase family protein n=1 Tax=unclassified Mesorhizobium TaxID=325217 RepID=UPI000FE9418D|nr:MULTISPECIES: fumarylacetoacetate hydrolase family protein [unclassified Mesorhizobium]MDG4852529.1 fumarylacetoacetate hydrolase family protein [Mesorhizobium sp. WSM4982]MDG4911978.1 fumarylacetoacetate hydrolase family protein [Mesorhizobium sp. WSM4983]RWN00877.1 MAG: FAA hydrolase family protein [Mesorhizobium sp.]